MATKVKSGVFFVPINQIKANRKNPRIIKDDKFEKLVKSIQEFPEMLEKRPLVCFTDTDGKFVVLGGNMRLKASQAAGLSELPITLADDWTEEKKAEFLIKDNVSFGEWSFVDLQDWDTELLDDWGLNIPNYENTDVDLNAFFEEDNTEKEEKFKITLEYSEDDYNAVTEALKDYTGSKESIFLKLLGL